MATDQPFKSAGQTSVALTTAGVSVATGAPIPGDGENILIINQTSVTAFCDFQTATFSASAGSPYIIPPNSRMMIMIGRIGPLFGAAMPLATASGPVYFMRGDGSYY